MLRVPRMFLFCALAIALAAAAVPQLPRADPFRVNIIHLNDFHARYEEILPSGGACPADDSSQCVGGIARVVAAVKSLQEKLPDSLLLNAGDNFQGTLWFSVYGWNVTAAFLNRLNWTAITLGNHEFDRKLGSAEQFIKALNAPVVVANIDDSKEPSFQGIYQKSIVREYGGRKIGIIGVITDTTGSISSPEGLVFENVASSVAAEGRRLKEQGVNIVVVLSHAGIEVDLEVAAADPLVDVIVGGHSHTLLHNGGGTGGETPYAEYPIIVDQPSGRKVAVVQAGSYSRYVGNLTAFFNDAGELISAEGDTIYLDKSITPDPATEAAMKPWAEGLTEMSKTQVGRTAVLLEQNSGACGGGECNLGNLVADAHVYDMVGKGPAGTWTRATIAFTNSGGLRAPIAAGNITFNDLVTCLPFENTIDYLEMKGKHIKAALEQAVSQKGRRGPRAGPWKANYFGFLQLSGLKVVYDVERELNNRVVSVDVLCHKCDVPVYEPLEDETWYPVTVNSFLAGAGDGYTVFVEESRNFERGNLDTDVMRKYFDDHGILTPSRDGRIVFRSSAADGQTLELNSRNGALAANAPLGFFSLLVMSLFLVVTRM